MKKKLKVIIIVMAVAAAIGITFCTVYFIRVKNYKNEVSAMSIENVDLADIPDGTYEGDCDVDFIYAKVKVTIKNGIITEVNILKHKNGKGKPAERITDDIIKKQSIKVDTVSGATNSSKVIMKAVENALRKARN